MNASVFGSSGVSATQQVRLSQTQDTSSLKGYECNRDLDVLLIVYWHYDEHIMHELCIWERWYWLFILVGHFVYHFVCMYAYILGSQRYLLSLMDCFMLYSTAMECGGSQYRWSSYECQCLRYFVASPHYKRLDCCLKHGILCNHDLDLLLIVHYWHYCDNEHIARERRTWKLLSSMIASSFTISWCIIVKCYLLYTSRGTVKLKCNFFKFLSDFIKVNTIRSDENMCVYID